MPPPNCVRQEQPYCGYSGRYLVPASTPHAHSDNVIHALQRENKRLSGELAAALKALETAQMKKQPQPVSNVARTFLRRLAKATHDGLVASNERKVRNMFMGDFTDMLVVEFNEIMNHYEDVAEEYTDGPEELEKLPESLDKKTIKAWFQVFKNHAIELEMAARQKKGVARRLEEATAHVPNKYMQHDDGDAWGKHNKARAVRAIVNRAIANKRKRS